MSDYWTEDESGLCWIGSITLEDQRYVPLQEESSPFGEPEMPSDNKSDSELI